MIKAIVTDIEGTTSSLSFVKDTLFPYARAHVAEFVREHRDNPQVQALLDDAREEAGAELAIEPLIEIFIQWIDADKKVTPLKSLQGLIWEQGYRQGAFKGHIYADALDILREWKAKGLDLYVYSSGSVQAQKFLFAYTGYGDLTPLFSGFFDTHIGGKKETESYTRIAARIGCSPEQLLFLSDIKEELDAARTAGYQTVWLTRDRQPDPQAEHQQVDSFNDIRVERPQANIQ